MEGLRTGIFVFFLFFSAAIAFADHGDKRGGRHEGNDRHEENGHRYEKEAKNFSQIPSNELYALECGACHLAYSPGLLPASSWRKMIDLLPAHFDDSVLMDEQSLKQISSHLYTYAADQFNVRKERKKAKRQNAKMPLRITETPCFIKEHHELEAEVFQRKSVGSRSNCIACHTSADQGVYDEKYVTIPKE